MKNITFLAALVAATFCGISPTWADEPRNDNLVTVTAQNAEIEFVPTREATSPAIVLDRRRVELAAGRSTLVFENTPQTAILTSLQLSSKTPLEVLETSQNPGRSVSLYNFIGQTLTLQREKDTVSGKLLSANPVMLETGQGVLLNPVGTWVLPRNFQSENGGLQWKVDAPTGGRHELEARYAATGITWSASYNALLRADNTLDWQGFISFSNATNANWRNAVWSIPISGAMLRSTRGVDLLPNSTQQVAFVSRQGIPASTRIVMGPPQWENFFTTWKGAPQLSISLANGETKDGAPLPPGSVALWRQTEEGAPQLINLQFAGAAPGGTVTLPLGNAEGLEATRVAATRRLNPQKREHTITYTVKNNNQKAVSVLLKEILPTDADNIETQPVADETDGRHLQWNLEIPSGEEASVVLTIQTGN